MEAEVRGADRREKWRSKRLISMINEIQLKTVIIKNKKSKTIFSFFKESKQYLFQNTGDANEYLRGVHFACIHIHLGSVVHVCNLSFDGAVGAELPAGPAVHDVCLAAGRHLVTLADPHQLGFVPPATCSPPASPAS